MFKDIFLSTDKTVSKYQRIKLERTSEIIHSTSLLQATASYGLNETPVKGYLESILSNGL